MKFQKVIDMVTTSTDGAFTSTDVLFWCNQLMGIIDAEVNIPQFEYTGEVAATDDIPIPIAYQSVFFHYCMEQVAIWQRDKDEYELQHSNTQYYLRNYATFLRRLKEGVEVNDRLYNWI